MVGSRVDVRARVELVDGGILVVESKSELTLVRVDREGSYHYTDWQKETNNPEQPVSGGFSHGVIGDVGSYFRFYYYLIIDAIRFRCRISSTSI